MKLYISCIALLFCMIACKNDTTKVAQVEQKVEQAKAPHPSIEKGQYADPAEVDARNEAEVQKLYQNYHQNPQTVDQIDENKIIDYAMQRKIAVKRTKTGLYYQILVEGNGVPYKSGQAATAHYRGFFLDGKLFDSSYARSKPIDFKAGQMNTAWNEAMTFMSPGTKALLLVPSKLGYGNKGFPGYVPPNVPIAFDLELLE